MKRQVHGRAGKLSAIAIASTLGFTPQAVLPGTTDISDIPMVVKNLVRPNVMFMLDNSGSMNNIVPDAPFDETVTYLSSCPTNNTVPNGVTPPTLPTTQAFEIRIVNGIPMIRYGGTNFDFGTAATGTHNCFDPALNYLAKINADNTSCATGTACPSGYLPAIYTGNYLNWYFSASLATTPDYTSSASFGIGASVKPGTKSRMEIAKTAAKGVVDGLDRVRLGLATYNSGDGGDLREIMGDVDSAKRTAVKQKIDNLSPGGNTPLAETLSDIGRYFTTGYTGSLTLHPGTPQQSTASISDVFSGHALRDNTGGQSVTTPPIQYFCQRSFAVLLTDGRPQGDQCIIGPLEDYDGDCSGTTATTGTTGTLVTAASTPLSCGVPTGAGNAEHCTAGGQRTTSPHFDRKLGGSYSYEPQGSDFLDDVAKALFEIDLRPDLNSTPANPAKKNNIVTYAIGFADEQVKNDPLLQDTADNGGGLKLTASNSGELVRAFQQAAEDILSKDGSAAAVAVANANVVAGDNISYASTYNSGTWFGDLEAFLIDVTTGNITTAAWGQSAGTQLDALATGNGNNASGQRKIVTYNGTSGVAFRWSDLSSTQQAALNTPVTPPGTTDGQRVLDFLRGDRTREGTDYRSRTHLLGDIVNAEPVVVREPNANYVDAGYKDSATSFKVLKSGRTHMVYQGANDGMLHAFQARGGSGGQEAWAYVPSLVFANLNNLSRKSGFVHKYYVDGTPTAGDVNLGNTVGGSGTSWRTLLVGGLRKGGVGYYALDVTDPLPNDETVAATKLLWEFPNSTTAAADRANLGYGFAKPVIVKTQATGWVVLVTSGYNNHATANGGLGGNGQGYLYVLNARTGALVRPPISTGVGSTTDPSGLAQISAYVENTDVDNVVEYVYGGDLKGNVWRFDLTGNANQWSVTKLATLTDGTGSFQPITTAPELARFTGGGLDKRLVYVGTGLYLGDTDVPQTTGANTHASQVQTMYALVDDLTTPNSGAVVTSLRGTNGTNCPTGGGDGNLVCQKVVNSTTTTRILSNHSVNLATKKGWYFDLPSSGERVVTDPSLALGTLTFTSNIPSSTPCIPGGSSWFYTLNYTTGGAILNTAGQPLDTGVMLGDQLSSRPVLVKLPSGQVKAIIRKSDAVTDVRDVPVAGAATGTRRISWRELLD